jgi:branched-chain amino acid transport system substrate-binding protein
MKLKKLFLVFLSLALLTALLITACSSAPSPSATTAKPAASSSAPAAQAGASGPSEIVIGAARSMTGMFAGMGEGGEFGFKATIDDINASGGIFVKQYNKKLPVKEILVDTQSNPVKMASLAENLILRDKVNFVTTSNGTTDDFVGVANLADKYKMPYLSVVGPAEVWGGVRSQIQPPWQYSWALGFAIGTPAPANDFRNKPGYIQMESWMAMLGKYNTQTNKVIGIFASDDGAGRGFYAGIAGALKGAGVQTVGVDKELGIFPMGTNDYTPIIKQWMDNKVEILWGNSPAPEFGTMWRQCQSMGFKPKMVFAGRAALYYTDVSSWGGDLPNGIGCELQWAPTFKNSPGIGSTTPQSLADRWTKAKNQPLNEAIGWDYTVAQVFFSAIEKAGTLDGTEVNKALAATDMTTIWNRVLFDDNHFSRVPISFGQWVKTDKPGIWEHQVVFSAHDFVPIQHDPIFPIPYK